MNIANSSTVKMIYLKKLIIMAEIYTICFLELQRNDRADCAEIYYAKESSEPYEDYEDLIETEFSDLEVE